MIDAISAASIGKVGDSDAAASVKRVPGGSVEDGKYIYVRGLSDRYTKTLMNGFEISGLDPDRNTIQMDIFPTSILDNIVVNKTFIASMPADFTGGIIDITTKAMPDEKQGGISVSAGYSAGSSLVMEWWCGEAVSRCGWMLVPAVVGRAAIGRVVRSR